MNSILKLFQTNIKTLHKIPQNNIKRLSDSQKRRKSIKLYKSQPHKFVLSKKIRNIDLKKPNLIFPLTIPLKLRYIYKPQKHTINIPLHDYINFKQMTGNEILLNLQNHIHLRPSELCSALIEITKREGSCDIDWNKHEWISQITLHVIKQLPTYDASVVGYMIVAFQRLKIENKDLWAKLQICVEKTIHKFIPKAFAFCYIAFLENTERCTNEFRTKLQQLLPIHLHKMTPDQIIQCFESTIKNNLLNEYLFENHFHVIIWRRNVWFGVDNVVKILHIYPKIDFVDDIEFFNKSIFDNLPNVKNQMNEENTKQLIDAINQLQLKYPEVKSTKILKMLDSHLIFCQTKLKSIENAKFYNIVLDDFQKYQNKKN